MDISKERIEARAISGKDIFNVDKWKITIETLPSGYERSDLFWEQEASYPYSKAYEDGWEMHTIYVSAEVDSETTTIKLPLCWIRQEEYYWDHVHDYVQKHNLIDKAINNLVFKGIVKGLDEGIEYVG